MFYAPLVQPCRLHFRKFSCSPTLPVVDKKTGLGPTVPIAYLRGMDPICNFLVHRDHILVVIVLEGPSNDDYGKTNYNVHVVLSFF